MYLEVRVVLVAVCSFSFVATQYVPDDYSAYSSDPYEFRPPHREPDGPPSSEYLDLNPHLPHQNPYPPQIPNYPQIPFVSCPQYFRYIILPRGQIEGLITVPLDSRLRLARRLELHVNASVVAYYDDRTKLKLELLSDPQQIVNGQANEITFLLMFPVQSSIPKITSIILNSQRYCTAENFKPNQRNGVTNMYANIQLTKPN